MSDLLPLLKNRRYWCCLTLCLGAAASFATPPHFDPATTVFANAAALTITDAGQVDRVSDGKDNGNQVLCQKFTSTEKGIYWALPLHLAKTADAWRLFVHARVGQKVADGQIAVIGVKGLNDGLTFASNDYMPPLDRRLLNRVIYSKELSATTYTWLDAGSFDPEYARSVWIAPFQIRDGNALYIDRIALVPWSTNVRHPNWKNALSPTDGKAGQITLGISTRIVIPAAPAGQDQKAAADLQLYLNRIFNVRVPIVKENGAFSANGDELSVGPTLLWKAAANQLPKTPALITDGYGIWQLGRTLFFFGGDRRGPINAVYAFLEEDLGCRWYAPFAVSAPARKQKTFTVVSRLSNPAFPAWRSPFYSDVCRDPQWTVANRIVSVGFNTVVPEEWGGGYTYGQTFCHTYGWLVPQDLFKTHPEYFSLMNGQRTPAQLCLSNPNVVDIMIQTILRIKRERPEVRVFDVSPNDGSMYCECAPCVAFNKAQGGTQMGIILHTVNAVAAAVRREYPDVEFTTLAYTKAAGLPKTIRPGPGVMIVLCTDSHAWATSDMQDLSQTKTFQGLAKAWEDAGARWVMWDYPVKYEEILSPLPNLPSLCRNIQWAKAHHAAGVFEQAENEVNYGASQGLLKAWVLSKLLWDPNRNVDTLVKDFNDGFYGPAAPFLQEYTELLNQMFNDYQREWGRQHQAKPDSDIIYLDYQTFVTKARVAKALALFAAAEKAVQDNPVFTSRVQQAKMPLLYQTLKNGPDQDGQKYQERLKEFIYIARSHKVRWITNICAAEDFDQTINLWLKLANSTSKEKIFTLVSSWRFRTDPASLGDREQWYLPSTADLDWAIVDSSRGTWDAQGFKPQAGLGWYRAKIAVPPYDAASEDLILAVEGIDEEAWCYVNGKLFFERTVASTGRTIQKLWNEPIVLVCTGRFKPGEQLDLTVKVRNHEDAGGIYGVAGWVVVPKKNTAEIMADTGLLFKKIQASQAQ